MPNHRHLVAADTKAVVYHAGEIVYGCRYGSRVRYILGGVLDEPESYGGVEALALSGPIAAYGLSEFGKYSGIARWRVVVRNLRTGKIIQQVPSGRLMGTPTPPGSLGTGGIKSIVVRRSGAVAWIAGNYQLAEANAVPYYYQVHTLDSDGMQAVVGEGAHISLKSLAIAGNTVYWTQEGTPRSAPLE